MGVVAVVGVGAVGGAIAAHLSQAGQEEVILCVREVSQEVGQEKIGEKNSGLVLDTPKGKIWVQPPVITDPETLPSPTWILLATKAHQVAGTASWLRRVGQSQGGVTKGVAILQNGVEHVERVAPYVAGGVPLLPVVVQCPSIKVGPGHVIQAGPAQLFVPDNDVGQEFGELFRKTDVRVQVTPDFLSIAWRKLCMNVAGGALTALTNQPLGIMRDQEIARLARGLILETIGVGRAEGAVLEDQLADQIVANMVEAPPNRWTSMLMDRRRNRALEFDAVNGAVVRIGAHHGLETPLNQVIIALLNGLSHSVLSEFGSP